MLPVSVKTSMFMFPKAVNETSTLPGPIFSCQVRTPTGELSDETCMTCTILITQRGLTFLRCHDQRRSAGTNYATTLWPHYHKAPEQNTKV